MEKLKYSRLLIISDNAFLISAFHGIAAGFQGLQIDYACSAVSAVSLENVLPGTKIGSINVKADQEAIASKYDLIFSLHCKQLFPAELVKRVKCINVHPGYNPNNRGWFPQVFSILNNKTAGATIHEIDEQLDHGAIIARKEIKIHSWETSFDVYNKVQLLEVEMLKENLPSILGGSYQTIVPEEEGNINLKKDFNALCQLDLNKEVTMGEAINHLRALTHGKYANAFFLDPETGSKVFVKISLERQG